MGSIVVYLIESAFCLALLYIFFFLFLKKETYFRVNRFYLIGSIFLSLLFPLLEISFTPATIVNLGYVDVTGMLERSLNHQPEPVLLQGVQVEEKVFNISIGAIFLGIYLLGFTFFLLRFIFHTLVFASGLKTSKFFKEGRFKFIYTEKEILPFSFFNRIIFNPDKHPESELEHMIAHERVHASQLHSVDILLIELLVVLQWFNPFVYQLRKSVIEIHEYLADKGVLDAGTDKIDYQKLLLKQVIDSRFSGLTSQFSYSLSKKRLKMMTRIKSGLLAKIKLLASVPLAILLFIVFSCTKAIDEIPPQITNDFIETQKEGVEGEFLTHLSFQFEKDQTLENGIILSGKMNYTLDIKSVPGSKSNAVVHIYSPDKKEIANNLYQDGSVSDKIQFWIEEQGEYSITVTGERGGMGSSVFVLSYNVDDDVLIKNFAGMDDVYTKVEIMPIFDGGTSGFRRYIQNNLVYPKEAAEQGFSGDVFLTFIVDKEGRVGNVEIIRSAHKLLDAEAIRVIESSPMWIPGKKDGENVNVQFTVPIKFRLK